MAEAWGQKESFDEPDTIVIVTASNDRQAAAVEVELTRRKQSGAYGPNVLFFCVPDPSAARVGSGGATFNALITVEELISSSSRWTLDRCRVFMIHSGGDSQRLPCQSVCGKAWSALPTYSSRAELDAPIDLLITAMFRMFRNVRSGLIVASSDVLLMIPDSFPGIWPQEGATGLAIPTPKHLGPNHGVYHVDNSSQPLPETGCVRTVAKFYQKATVDEMAAAGAVRSDGTVLIDTGVIYFSLPATHLLLSLARTYPLDCCTYLGLDMSRKPLRLELYSDIMMAMGGGMGMDRVEYGKVASSEADMDRLHSAREILWAQLRSQAFYAAVVEGGSFSHVGTTTEYLQLLTCPSPMQALYGLRTKAAYYQEGGKVLATGCEDVQLIEAPVSRKNSGSSFGVSNGAGSVPSSPPALTSSFTVLNSLFHSPGLAAGPGSVVEHSQLSGDWLVGAGALVSSLRSFPHCIVRDGMAVQELRVMGGKRRVLTVLAVTDPIKDMYTKASARIGEVSWGLLFDTVGVGPEDIWPDVKDPAGRTIWTAKLWPVFPPQGESSHAGEGVNPLDPVTADRASMWLQWLAHIPNDGYHGLSNEAAVTLRRTHLAPNVLTAWRTAPRLSLRDLLGQADATAEFQWRRALRGSIDVRLLVAAVSQASSVPISALVKRLGRTAIPVASLTEGVGTAVSDVAAGVHGGKGMDEDRHAALAHDALKGLDAIAATANPDVAGRALAVQSALLWAMAGWGSHGHRSGPAHNTAWLPCFSLLEVDYSKAALPPAAQTSPAVYRSWSSPMLDALASGNSRALAVSKLAALRDSWAGRPHLIGRAARHYERAAQLLTAQCIATAPIHSPVTHSLPSLNAWVLATCPVRIDLAGGWSDTPPITFEAPASKSAEGGSHIPALRALQQASARGGGLVVNVGVTLDGAQPLGARARRVAQESTAALSSGPCIIIRTRASQDVELRKRSAAQVMADAISKDGEYAAPGEVVSTVVLSALDHLADYNQPHAEGALVKCALLCMGLVRLPQLEAKTGDSEAVASIVPPLSEQLHTLLRGSMEVETWSLVPQGSGLGTSSILAAATLVALCRAAGREYDHASLNHMVLKIEQMLSTGGGWQDQVGGLWPGVKASTCAAALPVTVDVHPLDAAGLGPLLSSHMFLLYTGKTRLAKNLLQRVLRQWAMREGTISETVEDLRSNAVETAQALLSKDVGKVGSCLSLYWTQKKRMAPMAEPGDVTEMLRVLAPHVHGASLCGAGGGGFLAGISKVAGEEGLQAIRTALHSDPKTSALGWTLHSCAVDYQGLLLKVQQPDL